MSAPKFWWWAQCVWWAACLMTVTVIANSWTAGFAAGVFAVLSSVIAALYCSACEARRRYTPTQPTAAPTRGQST